MKKESKKVLFKCLKCHEVLESLDEIENHFDSEHPDEEINYDLYNEELANAIQESKEETIEETPEENPEEESSISDEELGELEDLKEKVIDYDLLTKREQDDVLDKVLPSKKKLRAPVTTTNLIETLTSTAVERILSDDSFICPFCHKDLQAEARLDGEELTLKPRPAKLEHLSKVHPSIAEALKAFKIVPSERRYDDVKRDDAESCSKEEEKLTKETLASKIQEDSEEGSTLRKLLLRRWKAELSKDED